MSLCMTDDRILVLPDKVETETKEGIVIPGAKNKRPTTGKIVSRGPAVTEHCPPEGARVIFSLYGGVDYAYDGTLYTILREEEIIAYEN